MNPVDHPHGGRSNGGCCWVTPWGKPFKFKKTSNSLIKKIYKLL
jgi:large subunit ribosomal protein L2